MAEKQEEKSGSFKGKKQDKQQEKPVQARRPQQAPPKALISPTGKEVRGIVRLAGRDLVGTLPIRRAIISVKGIGLNLGSVVSKIAYSQIGINENTMVGELTEEQTDKLEHILRNPGEYGIPSRMFNRQRDMFTGSDVHYIGSDLVYVVKQDIDHEKDSYTWKGYRHTYGQKVRGQRTRSTGRTGMTVGVLRKAVLAKAGAAATAQTGAAAQAAGTAAPAAAGAKATAPKAPVGTKPAAKPAEAKK
ncbi:MAG: 30S ribosomal protein S13 [Candidatus Micrarchaeota archaeon]|nr:30S ribosomal protein S13 [Candidatus Micrarchaeota archaeon]